MTIDERHELEDKYRHLGYCEGRTYLMDALTEDFSTETDQKVKDYIYKFIRTHSDTAVEVR